MVILAQVSAWHAPVLCGCTLSTGREHAYSQGVRVIL
jgi:hypothetical protein